MTRCDGFSKNKKASGVFLLSELYIFFEKSMHVRKLMVVPHECSFTCIFPLKLQKWIASPATLRWNMSHCERAG